MLFHLAGGYGYFPSATQQTPRRYLAYVAAFSQLATVSQTYEYLCGRLRLKFDDVRLWFMKDDVILFYFRRVFVLSQFFTYYYFSF
jgi:hypothetical protein